MDLLRSLTNSRPIQEHGGLLAALALLILLSVAFVPYFGTLSNGLDILRQLAFDGIIALGMTLVIIAGEIDISVGSAIAFSSSMFGVLAVNVGLPLWLTTVAVLALGAAIGLGAGFMRAWFNVPSFIVTLALFSALKGGALAWFRAGSHVKPG